MKDKKVHRTKDDNKVTFKTDKKNQVNKMNVTNVE